MIDINTPYRMAVHLIIHSVMDNSKRYWIDEKTIRWWKIERDLWDLEKTHLLTAVEVDAKKECTCNRPRYSNYRYCPDCKGIQRTT